MGKRKAYKIVATDGPPCPRCGKPTEIREHIELRERQRRAPFYYSRWFNCTNAACQTSLIMPPEFMVWNDNEAAHELQLSQTQRGPTA